MTVTHDEKDVYFIGAITSLISWFLAVALKENLVNVALWPPENQVFYPMLILVSLLVSISCYLILHSHKRNHYRNVNLWVIALALLIPWLAFSIQHLLTQI